MGIKCPKCQHENPDDTLYCGKCAAPLKPTSDIAVTETIEVPKDELARGTIFANRYEIIEELGKGGMGRVYRAYDKQLEEEVAIKLLKSEIAADKKTLDRFKNEIKLARKIIHRNVCRMHDLHEERNTKFITMEYVVGEDLKSLLRRVGKVPVEKAVFIAHQIAEGLAEAHRLGVIHRDLKPHNVMIDKEGNARIMDFGIARSLGGRELTGEGVIIGTPDYMSPEQAEGKEADSRSDIYSLGVILYEMVTGQVPFEGETALSVAHKHKYETPSDPKMINVQIPDDLSHLILMCLEKDKERRYQNAGEVQSELKRIEERITTSGEILPIRRSGKKSKRGRFKPYVIPGLIIVASVIIAAVFISLSGVLKREKAKTDILAEQIWKYKIIILPFENLGPPDDQYFADGITEEITSRLSLVRDLGVISRQTAVQYDRTGKTIHQIGDDLEVDYVLEGTIRWDRSAEGSSRILVTPQLIRVSDDTHLWSDRYLRIIEDIFAVQSDIAEQVIRQIDATLLKSFQSFRQTKPTENLEAYDLYLRGLEKLGVAPLETEYKDAIEMFEQAVALDPEFALAYARLSQCHSTMYLQGYDQTEDRKKKAMEAAMKALELEPNLAEAHLSLGRYYYHCYKDYDKALEEISIAERFLPNDERVMSLVAFILRRQGCFNESLAKLRKALQLNPKSIVLLGYIAYSYMNLRNYKEADNYYRKSISLAPDQQMRYQELALNSLLWKGDLDEAKKIIEEMPKDENPESFWYWIELDLVERNYQKALDRLTSTSVKTVIYQRTYQPIEQYIGQTYYLMNELKSSNINYELARVRLEEKIIEQPDDPRIHSSLGIVYAMLGRKEDALREGKLGVDLYPISKDALISPSRVEDLAQIYTILGMYDDAIDLLEHLLSIPSLLSVPMLKLHPKWDNLREHPRFEAMLD